VTTLGDTELDRYARQIILPEVGGVGQRRIKAASLGIIGAGGIGSAAIPALAGAGVGRISIVDGDVVERSNLHRQTIFRDDQLGGGKADLAAHYARALNPDISAEGLDVRLDSNNAEAIIAGHDLVLDGCDNFATRLAVSDAATRARIPLVSAAAAQFQAQIGLFRGWQPAQPCYRCFVGDAFDTDDCDTCAERGVLGALAGLAGHFAALAAIQAIVGCGSDQSGKLHIFQALTATWRTIRVPKDPGCRTCGGGDAANS
jgi:adenylyltransferase/sulfurtransferase